jgi:hypothetical protein
MIERGPAAGAYACGSYEESSRTSSYLVAHSACTAGMHIRYEQQNTASGLYSRTFLARGIRDAVLKAESSSLLGVPLAWYIILLGCRKKSQISDLLTRIFPRRTVAGPCICAACLVRLRHFLLAEYVASLCRPQSEDQTASAVVGHESWRIFLKIRRWTAGRFNSCRLIRSSACTTLAYEYELVL